MTLESLAQDISDKTQAVLDKKQSLALAKMTLSEATAALSDALCDEGGPVYDKVAINLLYHVVICEWNGDGEYDVTFISKATHENP